EQSHQHVAIEDPPRWKKLFLPAAVVMLVILVSALYVAQSSVSSSDSLTRGQVSQLTFDSGIETAPSLSPDGKTFVFVKGTASERQIYLQRVDGRSAIRLSSSADHDDHDPMYSPDGSQIVFRSERDGGGLFLMGATGESVRRLTSQGHTPSWSPDGSEVYFVSEELNDPTSRSSISTISKVAVGTGTVETVFEGDAMQPMVSPNAKRIAYWGLPDDGGGQRDIYTVALTGDPATVVPATADLPLDWNPVWEPDGQAILFASDRGGTMNVWRLAIDEESGEPKGDPEPVGVPATWAGRISMSRDGSAIVWESKLRTQEVWMGRLDEAGATFQMDREPVLSGSMLIRTAEPSPTGDTIAFTSDGNEDVYVVNADGTDLRQLTNDSARDRGASWAPDGSRIYFYSTRGGTYDAWSILPDGSGARQQTTGYGLNYPVVSPDGNRVAGFEIETSRGHIAPLRDDAVSKSDATVLPPLSDGRGFWPTGWSPDGSELLGVAWGEPDLRFFIYSLEDQRYEQLDLPGPGRWSNLNPARFIDGDRLALSLADGVYIFDRSTGEARRAADAEAATFSLNGRFVLSEIERQESDVWHMTLGER
ncbi:MAG: hypothetical protein R3338_01690, partial [Thermoanaerobaculia bacterium]|nr:hypothetical protein [Thermoanaerobaculia bacterium]